MRDYLTIILFVAAWVLMTAVLFDYAQHGEYPMLENAPQTDASK